MYSLNIPHSNQNPSFFLCKTQYPSFQNSDFGDISLRHHKKIILTFFVSCDFTVQGRCDYVIVVIVTVDVITYYIVCLSFPGPQAKFS